MDDDEELFDFPDDIKNSKTALDAIHLMLDFSCDHQIGPIVSCMLEFQIFRLLIHL